MRNKRLKWILLALLVLGLLSGVWRALASRQVQKEALQAQQALQKETAAVELSPTDVLVLQMTDMAQVLPISGPIKAARSAFVKAQVSGELQGLAVREGDFVKEGQVLAKVDSTEYLARLRQAQQQAESAKGQLTIAQRNFENNRSLVDQGFISRTALDTSTGALVSAEANYRAAQAGAEVAQKYLQDAVLRAPISGYVAQRLAQSGERVSVDAKVVEIVDLSRLELEASLSAADSMDVSLGQKAQLTIEGASKTLSAKVVRINPSTVAGSRAVLAYLALESDSGLRQGLFAQGQLALGKTRKLGLPLSAVRTDKPQPYVQVVVKGTGAELGKEVVAHPTVTLGIRAEWQGQPMVEVLGLKEGSEVLVGAVGPLREGTLVRRVKAVP